MSWEQFEYIKRILKGRDVNALRKELSKLKKDPAYRLHVLAIEAIILEDSGKS